MTAAAETARLEHEACMYGVDTSIPLGVTANKAKSDECARDKRAIFAALSNDVWERTLPAALVPVALAWLAACLLYVVGRWVLAGRRGQRG